MNGGTATEPHLMSKKKVGGMDARVEFVASSAWMERIERQAERHGMSVGAYLRLGANERLEKDEATEPKPRPKPKP